MNDELGFSPEQYGLGAGIFFVGYLAGQFPSVLLLQRFGMRRWVSACALIWGTAATSMAGVDSVLTFYTLRVILGLAEAGLASGIVIYLCQWTTDADRARTFALPMLAIPISTIFGAPLSGWLLTMDTPWGLSSWRWMFLAEGLPTLLVGAIAYFYFPNHPREAKWLSHDEQQWLQHNSIIASSPREPAKKNDYSVLLSPAIWLTAGVWFSLLAGAYGIMFWLPQIVEHSTGHGAFIVSIVSAVPWLGAAIGMLANSWHSDRTHERFWHVGLPIVVAALSIAMPVLFTLQDSLALLALFVAGIGLGAAQGAFWAMPTSYLDPRSLTIAVPAINIAGSSAGLLVPSLIGWARESTGSFQVPIYLVTGILLIGAVIVMIVRVLARQWRFNAVNISAPSP
jgi:ACS family tartrate transporter-like MFS transporter